MVWERMVGDVAALAATAGRARQRPAHAFSGDDQGIAKRRRPKRVIGAVAVSRSGSLRA